MILENNVRVGWLPMLLMMSSVGVSRAHTDATGFDEELEADSIAMSLMLDDVAVAGYKVNRHNLTPASVAVMGGMQLQQKLVSAMTDLSGNMPNVFIPDYGSSQTTPVVIRGIYSKVKGTAVGYYVDGMPHFELSAFDTDMLDVKAIELYRGPQGTLYGRNTIGGVICVSTYNPFEYQNTKLRIGCGNYGALRVQASHTGLIGQRWGVVASGYYEHHDGYFTNEHLGKKADRNDAGGGRLALYFRPAEGWELRLSSALDHTDQGGYPYAPYDVEKGEVMPISYNRPAGYRRTISTSGFGARYANERMSINSQTTLQWVDDSQRMDQDFTADDIYYVTNGVSTCVVSEELTAKSEHEGRWQWVTGLFAFSQTGSQKQGTDYLTKGYRQQADYRNPVQGAAAYAQTSYNIWRGLSVTAGLRIDYEKSSMNYDRNQTSHADGAVTHVSDFRSSQHYTELIPRFSMQYEWTKKNLLFASVTRGYKGGGFNASFQNEAERSYDPEHNWNYEAGMKWMTPTGTFGGEATLFYIDWRDQHISRVVTGVGNVISNAAHSDSKGVELTLSGRPMPELTLNASYGYSYARFLDYRKSTTADYSGHMIPLVPRHTLSADVAYAFHPKMVDQVAVAAGVTGVGKLYWQEDNEVMQPFYMLPNVRLAVAKGRWNMALWCKNLTNTRYVSYYFTSSGRYAQKGRPMTMGVDLTISLRRHSE